MSEGLPFEVVPTPSWRPHPTPTPVGTAFFLYVGGDINLSIVPAQGVRGATPPSAPSGSAAATDRPVAPRTSPSHPIRRLVLTALAEIAVLLTVGLALTALAKGR